MLNEILNPVELHKRIIAMLQTQKQKSHSVIGECWFLLAVIQTKFSHLINPIEKKQVQDNIFF